MCHEVWNFQTINQGQLHRLLSAPRRLGPSTAIHRRACSSDLGLRDPQALLEPTVTTVLQNGHHKMEYDK